MTKEQLSVFRSQLLNWFSKNKRELPWRKQRGWYKTYLSEIILQQTTVEQGLPYYEKFIKTYPTIRKLAQADEQQILHSWAGLGYYSRARNLHKAAKLIVKDYNSSFPDEYDQAIQIPGIGPYSASAILSMIYNKPFAAIDGNVIRVISRLFGLKDDVRLTKTLNVIKKNADFLLDKKKPGEFNEALMELGAMLCTSKKPHCTICPVNKFCKAFKKSIAENIPYKSPAKAKHKKYQIAFILENNSKFLIVRKPQKGLLAGMWELPALETDQNEFNKGIYTVLNEKNIIPESESNVFRHIYSHIDLKYKAIKANINHKNNLFDLYVDQKWIKLKEFDNYAIHNAHKKLVSWLRNESKNQIPKKGKY